MTSAAAQPKRSNQPGQTPPTPRPARNGYYLAALAAILLAAGGLRVAASLNEFWFDEIWSYGIARDDVKGPLDVLAIHHENNNPLNTLLIYCMGPDQPFWAYRMPAVLAGVGAVALAGLIALRWGRVESVTAMILTAFSFLLIQNSSEARGYSLAVFFSMLCLLLGLQYVQKPGLGLAVALWASLAAAWLSQLTTVPFYASFLLWSAWALARTAGPWKRAVRPILLLHAAPLAILSLYYWACIRQIEPGRTQEDATVNVLARTVALWVGAPLGAAGTIVASAAALCGTALSLALLVRRRSALWVFFGGVLLLSPAILLAELRPAGPYERHFLVFLTFGLLLWALALAWLYRRGAWGKALFGLALAGFLAGNGYHTAWLLKVGRGHCVEAIQYLARNTPGDTILVASDYDVRVFSLIAFYKPRASVDKNILFWTRDKLPAGAADWLILHRQLYMPMPRYTADVRGHVYELAKSFEMMSPRHPLCLSGWSMYLYRNTNTSVQIDPGPQPAP